MRTVRIPIERLVPDPTQPRTTMADLAFDRLVASIRARGLLQPVRVLPADADGNHAIVFGHRRVAALTTLGATHVDCVVADGPPDAAAVLADQLAENQIRENLSPVEEAQAVQRYQALRGVTAARAAEELGVSAAHVSRSLALLDLPEEVRQCVHTGWIHRDTAYHLARVPAGERRDRLIARAVGGGLTRDEAAAAAKVRDPKPAQAAPAPSRVAFPLGGGRSVAVAGGAVTLESLIAALEEVLRESRKARTQGWHVGTLAKVFRDRAAKGGDA